jgi:hypothetical protein
MFIDYIIAAKMTKIKLYTILFVIMQYSYILLKNTLQTTLSNQYSISCAI